ncbi:SBBP repeat-containing protein [Emticicia agri]|uniref:Bulb-type lectin domain-containing protein n=1 Tax=Emticicia agri TaxID=2492393 RepID=A0A4Q5LWM6_9BACT|nr:SBBP repeat-containing protein [Emticicia agri]RYU93969.1 hypothetical protein EWM59_19610 [Emticicia agri]
MVQWAQSAGGTASELGTDIAVDAAGNVYITGGFSGTASFGSESVIANGSNMDIFVAKYSNAGVVQWAKSASGTGNDVGASIVVDASSNAYITGNYASIIMFGDHLVSSQSSSADIFVAKCNSSGEFLWVQSAGGAGNDSGSGIGIDGSGNIYLIGSYTGTATFGNTQTTSNGNLDIFVAKYDNSGEFKWVKSAGAADYDTGQSLAVESNGNVYVTGSYFGTITFGSQSVSSQGSRDLFVTKYDSNGSALWAKTAGGTFLEGGLGIAVDAGGV